MMLSFNPFPYVYFLRIKEELWLFCSVTVVLLSESLRIFLHYTYAIIDIPCLRCIPTKPQID